MWGGSLLIVANHQQWTVIAHLLGARSDRLVVNNADEEGVGVGEGRHQAG
jgi:ribosomal protein L32E